MYTALAIWSVIFIAFMWRFKKIYDKKLNNLRKDWVDLVNMMAGELDSRITADHEEIQKMKDGR